MRRVPQALCMYLDTVIAKIPRRWSKGLSLEGWLAMNVEYPLRYEDHLGSRAWSCNLQGVKALKRCWSGMPSLYHCSGCHMKSPCEQGRMDTQGIKMLDELCTIVVAAMLGMIRSKQLSRSSGWTSYSVPGDHPVEIRTPRTISTPAIQLPSTSVRLIR